MENNTAAERGASDEMVSQGVQALLQCCKSELGDYSLKLMDGYEADVKRVWGAMGGAAIDEAAQLRAHIAEQLQCAIYALEAIVEESRRADVDTAHICNLAERVIPDCKALLAASHPAPQAAAEGLSSLRSDSVGSIGDDARFRELLDVALHADNPKKWSRAETALVAYIDSRAATLERSENEPERSGGVSERPVTVPQEQLPAQGQSELSQLPEILEEAAAILNGDKEMRFPIVDELQGFALMITDRAAQEQAASCQDVPVEWRSALQEFVERVERGEIRSKATYAKFKTLLSTPPAMPQPRELTDADRYQAVKKLTKEQYLAWRGVYGCADEAIDQILSTAPAQKA